MLFQLDELKLDAAVKTRHLRLIIVSGYDHFAFVRKFCVNGNSLEAN